MTENGGSMGNHATDNPIVITALIFTGVAIMVSSAYCAGMHVANRLYSQHKRDRRDFERELRKEERRKAREERRNECVDWFITICEN